jgi:hypothetical protein
MITLVVVCVVLFFSFHWVFCAVWQPNNVDAPIVALFTVKKKQSMRILIEDKI